VLRNPNHRSQKPELVALVGGTGTVMHYGSRSGSKPAFGSGSNIKWYKKVKKIKSETKGPAFREIMLLITLERQDLCKFLFS
jgi:hypothetical protein